MNTICGRPKHVGWLLFLAVGLLPAIGLAAEGPAPHTPAKGSTSCELIFEGQFAHSIEKLTLDREGVGGGSAMFAIALYLITLPFLVLAFESPFYQDRLQKLFHTTRDRVAEDKVSAIFDAAPLSRFDS